MDHNPKSKASTSFNIEDLNPLNRHEIQDSFYNPCKHLRERVECCKDMNSQCFFLKSLLQEAVQEAQVFIKIGLRATIPDVEITQEVNIDPDTLEKFLEAACESVNSFQRMVFYKTVPTLSIINDANGSDPLRKKWQAKSTKSICVLEKIFDREFTSKGLSGLKLIESWFCYGFIEALNSLNEIFILKQFEDEQDFYPKADRSLKKMQLRFRQEICSALRVLKEKRSP